MNQRDTPSTAVGAVCGLSAYLAWGFIALYFKLLTNHGVSPAALLAHRVIWSTVFCLLLVAIVRASDEARQVLRNPKKMLALAASSVMIAINWLTFIYSIHVHQLGQSALGYYLNPLLSVLLAAVVLRERLRALEWVSVGLAAAGVILVIAAKGELPWIALSVAISFSLYSLLRKQIMVSPVIGLTVETALLAPIALIFLFSPLVAAEPTRSAGVYALLALSGAVTAVPLLLFAQAARVLRLSTLGFLQYLAPTCQFLLATLAWHEPVSGLQIGGFVCIWIGLILFTAYAAYSRPPKDKPPAITPLAGRPGAITAAIE